MESEILNFYGNHVIGKGKSNEEIDSFSASG